MRLTPTMPLMRVNPLQSCEKMPLRAHPTKLINAQRSTLTDDSVSS
jgi:hypothetical protein